MSDTEYEIIKATFPLWSDRVITAVKEKRGSLETRTYNAGYLSGLASAMVLTRQCSNAFDFIREVTRRYENNLEV